MADLQYIGARYVPKFYENPDDSSNDWKLGESYEPLTVVTYLDDSYTSKITVPASVGNPAGNPYYWAKTGNFNAGLTALQNRTTKLENTTIFFASQLEIPSGSDCTDILQDIIDNRNIEAIVFNDGDYIFNEVTLNRTIDISCKNGRIKGKFILDAEAICIHDCIFEGNLTKNAIDVHTARYLRLENNIFVSFDKAIYTEPLNGADYGSTASTDELFHKVGNWTVSGNQFINVNYVLYGDIYQGNDDPYPVNKRWMRLCDMAFIGNLVNTYNKTCFYVMGIDGLQILDNVCSIKDNPNLDKFLYFGGGYYLDVKNNHVWGSGNETIDIAWCDNSQICGNVFAQGGFLTTAPVIHYESYSGNTTAVISSNSFDQSSGTCIKIESTTLRAIITSNSYDKADNPHSLSNDPNRIFCDSLAVESLITDNEIGCLVKRSNLPFVTRGNAPIDFVDTQHRFFSDQEEFELVDMNGTYFNGIILISVNEANMYSERNAVYMCLCSAMGPISQVIPTVNDVSFFKQLDFVGLAKQTGTQGATDRWCKFSFKMSTDKKLIAVSENSLSTYKFRIMFIGDSAFNATTQ